MPRAPTSSGPASRSRIISMSQLDERARGVYIVAATPFVDSGAIDLDSTDRMVDFYLSRGVTGMTLLGMMGEAQKLSAEESGRFVRHVARRVSGAVPLVVGVSSPSFMATRELARSVMDDGCAGVMVAPPNTLRTDEQIVNFFQHTAQHLDEIPWVL